jgi:hypothetical protein
VVPRGGGSDSAGEDESVLVQRESITKPAHVGLGADEDKQGACVQGPALACLIVLDKDRLQPPRCCAPRIRRCSASRHGRRFPRGTPPTQLRSPCWRLFH